MYGPWLGLAICDLDLRILRTSNKPLDEHFKRGTCGLKICCCCGNNECFLLLQLNILFTLLFMWLRAFFSSFLFFYSFICAYLWLFVDNNKKEGTCLICEQLKRYQSNSRSPGSVNTIDLSKVSFCSYNVYASVHAGVHSREKWENTKDWLKIMKCIVQCCTQFNF